MKEINLQAFTKQKPEEIHFQGAAISIDKPPLKPLTPETEKSVIKKKKSNLRKKQSRQDRQDTTDKTRQDETRQDTELTTQTKQNAGQYNLTTFEACEYLNKSKRTITRYIKIGLLHPIQIKSRQGTIEYRFSKIDLQKVKIKIKEDETGQDTPDRTDETEQTRQDTEILDFLKKQIRIKDRQIEELSFQLTQANKTMEKLQKEK